MAKVFELEFTALRLSKPFPIMSPVATESQRSEADHSAKDLKAKNGKALDPSDLPENISSFNPFYSPPGDVADGDDAYDYNRYKVRIAF